MVVHGGAGGGAQGWLDNLPELCNHFTVYIPDLPGFGQSEPFSGDSGIDQFVEFINSFANSLNLKSFYLVGHSMGGAIAMRYAVSYRHKVKKLVIIDGVGVGKDVAPWIRLLTRPGICRPIGIAVINIFKAVKQVINKINSPLRLFNPLPVGAVLMGASITIFANEAEPLVLKLAALMIPTLFIWGARDKIVPVSNAYAAARLHPDSKLHVFENGGHFAYSREIKRFTALLADFLR